MLLTMVNDRKYSMWLKKPSRKCKTYYRFKIPPLESFKEHGTIYLGTASPKAMYR